MGPQPDGQIRGIGPDPGDEVRAPAAEERQPEDIETRKGGDATVVDDTTTTIERLRGQPRERRSVPGRPDHRGTPAQVQLGGRVPDAGGLRVGLRTDLARHPVLLHELVDPAQQPCLLEIGVGRQVGERPRALPGGAPDGHEPTHDLHALIAEHADIEVPTIVAADELHRRVPAGALDVVHLVVALVELADAVQPPVDVAPTVGTGQPDVLADREGDLAPGPSKFVGDLHAGR